MNGAGGVRALQINSLVKSFTKEQGLNWTLKAPQRRLGGERGEWHSGECHRKLNLGTMCRSVSSQWRCQLQITYFSLTFSILPLFLVFYNYMRKCLGLEHLSVYRMSCFSLKSHVSFSERVPAAFLLIDSFMFFLVALPEMCVIWFLYL